MSILLRQKGSRKRLKKCHRDLSSSRNRHSHFFLRVPLQIGASFSVKIINASRDDQRNMKRLRIKFWGGMHCSLINMDLRSEKVTWLRRTFNIYGYVCSMAAAELQIVIKTVGDKGIDLVEVGTKRSQFDLLCIVNQMWVGVAPCCWHFCVLFRLAQNRPCAYCVFTSLRMNKLVSIWCMANPSVKAIILREAWSWSFLTFLIEHGEERDTGGDLSQDSLDFGLNLLLRLFWFWLWGWW